MKFAPAILLLLLWTAVLSACEVPEVSVWKYRPGDNPGFAAAAFDDSRWRSITRTYVLPEDWSGTGWYRARLAVPPDCIGVPLALHALTGGSTTIFVNGIRVNEFDARPLLRRNPEPFILPDSATTVAIRYVLKEPDRFRRIGFNAGFSLSLEPWNASASRRQVADQHQFALVGLMLAFSLLHLVLFLFNRADRTHLYFAMMAASVALMVLSEQQEELISREGRAYGRRIWGCGMVLTSLSALRFTYSLGGTQTPRRFWVLCAVGAGLLAWGWTRLRGGWWGPAGAENYLSLFTLIALLEMVRAFVQLVRYRPSPSVRILGFGSFPIILTGIYQMLINFGTVPELSPLFRDVPLPYYAFLFMIFAMSVHLSRSYADTNRELERQLVQVRDLSEQRLEQERRAQQQELQRTLLEADNLRKTRELEDARRLQLSMLPAKVPLIPGLEACFYMKTATEVGGDYYDFYLNDPETLTIAVGDATGHGMQAGTVVAAAKSLFQSLAHKPELNRVLAEMSRVLRRMNFQRMYMALTLVRFHGATVQIACGGMPPPLLYRASENSVEPVKLKGIWLGGSEFPYEERQLQLSPGDTLLLMSDGYPEMFNPDSQILGYDSSRRLFAETAIESPSRIINALVAAGEHWANGRLLEDDVTFAALRLSENRSICFPCTIEVAETNPKNLR